jgi:hypothetical protein
MAEAWDREEVEATVADYFHMLQKELRGEVYNKTEHRRGLSLLLGGRSDGAIERKHQNISAILIELGFPYINGYKPLGNYQQLLFEVVSDRLKNNQGLIKLVESHVALPANIPELDDILSAMVNPPAHVHKDENATYQKVIESPSPYQVDYLAVEARNRSLGRAGELFVIRFEQARLIHAGKENLAAKVEHIAVTHGDSAGFDVLSFETTGQERLIEVKTTAYGPFTPFYVTSNEVDISSRKASHYHLYRSFDFRRQPRIFTKQGSLEKSFNLSPSQYIARVG